MKKLSLAAALVLSGLVSLPSYAAGTASNTFNVDINLTPGCSVSAAPGAVTFTYTGMQTAAVTAPNVSIYVQCTKNLPYSASLATAPGNGYNVIDALTNLAYTLTLNTAATDLLNQAGTGAQQTIVVGGTMAGGQAGTCPTAASCSNLTSANRQQTLTLTY